MKRTGVSASSLAPGFSLPMRFCSAVNGSGRDASALPGQHLAIEHASTGSDAAALFDLGKTPVQPFLAARPQAGVVAAPHQLGADAVPLPFGQPVARARPACPPRAPAARRGRTGRDDRPGARRRPPAPPARSSAVGSGFPVAAQAMRDQVGRLARPLRQRLHHQPLRHAHAQRAGEQLVEQKHLLRQQRAPPRPAGVSIRSALSSLPSAGRRCSIQVCSGTSRQRAVARRAASARWFRPGRRPAGSSRRSASRRSRWQRPAPGAVRRTWPAGAACRRPARTPPTPHRPPAPRADRRPSPRAWPAWRRCDPARHTGRRTGASAATLGVGAARSSAQWPRIVALVAQVADQRFAIAVGDVDAAGAALLDAAQQARPVGVVGHHEAAVVAAPATAAANLHPARGKPGGRPCRSASSTASRPPTAAP